MADRLGLANGQVRPPGGRAPAAQNSSKLRKPLRADGRVRIGSAPESGDERKNPRPQAADGQDRVNQARATAGPYLLTMPLAPAMDQFHFFFLSISGRSNANWNFLLLRESIRISTVGSGGRPA